MEKVLQHLPETPMAQPEGIVSARIDPKTGKLAPPKQKNAIFEIFRKEYVPTEYQKPDQGRINPFDLETEKKPVRLTNPKETKKKKKEDENIF